MSDFFLTLFGPEGRPVELTIGQTIAWSLETSYAPMHVQTARWLLEDAE